MPVIRVLKVNGEERPLGEVDPQTPLLWVLRDHLNLVDRWLTRVVAVASAVATTSGRPHARNEQQPPFPSCVGRTRHQLANCRATLLTHAWTRK